MAPEQLEGKEADKRSDIFALGSVLYEMVTGKRAFEGKTTASTIASILAAEPKPLSAMQPLSPPALEHVIATCIAKDPEERWQSCADVSRQLRVGCERAQARGAFSAQRKAPLDAAGGGGVDRRSLFAGYPMVEDSGTGEPVRSESASNTYFNFRGLSGPTCAFARRKQDRVRCVHARQKRNGWFVAAFARIRRESRFLPGTEGAIYPFWSPDGKFLAFFAGGRLKKLDLSGGSVIPVCDVIEGRGGTWSTEGVIIFGVRAGALFRVDASGGKPVPLTTLDDARHEISHRFPQFLPDQKHFLFVAQAPQITARVFVASLDSPQNRSCWKTSSQARCFPTIICSTFWTTVC